MERLCDVPAAARLRDSAILTIALLPAREQVDALGCELELCGRGADLAPGFVVDGNAVAFALRARFPLRLAGDAHAVVSGRGPRAAQPSEEALRVLLERLLRAQARRIDYDRDHSVQHAPLGLIVVVGHAAAGQCTAEQ